MFNHTRFLIVRLSSIGDILHTTTVARTLKRTYPQCHITWIVSRTEKTARVMAVAPPAGGTPIPLDMAFECFKGLTDDEKNKLRQFVNQHLNANTATNTGTHADTFGTTL